MRNLKMTKHVSKRIINSARKTSQKIKSDEKLSLRFRLPNDFMSRETVNHPLHYGGKDDVYETIKVLEALLTKEEFIGAMKFNVYKYNDRAKQKGNELENYQKAQFYQNYLVNYLLKKI